MTATLRIVLVVTCVLTCWYTLRKIRKSQMQIEDSLFWIMLSFGLVVFSIFPQVAEFLSGILGLYSPVNFVFLMFIFLLLMKVFTLTLKFSQMEERLKRLVQRIAIDEEKRHKEENKEKKENNRKQGEE